MAKKKDSRHRSSEDRKRDFMFLFAREAPYIRDSLVKDLPAYNMLLSMGAESFEELALREVARQRNVVYSKDSPILPDCPHCGYHESIGKKNKLYFCNVCQRKFAANYNSISSATKCDALTWMKVLQCILNFSGVTKTCEYCDITESTYYNLRSRLFYGMQLLLENVRLYGNVEVDNTFVRTSFKGMALRESEFSEDSIFYDKGFKPRAARSRGGAYSQAERNANHLCVFTAIDDRGHVLARFAGVGITSFRALKSYIPEDKFLREVPQKDPFGELFKGRGVEPKTSPGERTLMVADKESSIERYADFLGVDFESHVFREKGVQRRLSGEAHNIQRVNALHHRLKDFLRNVNYVSSKYLPGYLVLFEFIENTGASKEAIAELFRMLATPNLGKPAAFFQEMYTVPNYLQEWFDGDHPLKKLPYNKLLAFYLYDHIRHPEQYPGIRITMSYIEGETGYSDTSIRRFYNDLNAAGYHDMILNYFGEPSPKKDKGKKAAKKTSAFSTLNPVVLSIFDEYVENRKLPASQRKTLNEFLLEKNEQYGTNYKRANILAKFNYIVENGVRPPLPDLRNPERYINGRAVNDKAFAAYEEFERIVLSYRERGEKAPPNREIYLILAERYGLSVQTIESNIRSVRKLKKDKGR